MYIFSNDRTNPKFILWLFMLPLLKLCSPFGGDSENGIHNLSLTNP